MSSVVDTWSTSSDPEPSTDGSETEGSPRPGTGIARVNRLAADNPGDVKPVGHGVSELLIDYGPGYRVYYLHDGDRVILLLTGGDKSSQDADIRAAHQIAEEWRGRRP